MPYSITGHCFTDEVRHLENSVASVTEEAGKKTVAELSKIKDDYNSNIKSISQEVMRLETVRSYMMV